MSRLTKLYTNAEESYIDLICFEDLDCYDVLYEVLDYGQYHGLIDAIYKLAEYENIGSVEDFKHLKHELEVYKRAFDKFIETINKFEIEKLTTAQAIDTFFIRYKLIQKECLHQARKELEDERKTN